MLRKRVLVLIPLFIVIVWVSVLMIIRTPSNDRNWAQDQRLLPYAEFDNETITVKNIRNFSYQSRDTYTKHYYDKTIKLSDLESVDYIVEPLASVAAAHTFLSFGFRDGTRIPISVEIRKEEGEEFSPLRGMFEEYEIMYVIVDERDALTLRAIHRKNPVYVYPTTATKEMAGQLFITMLHRVNELTHTPEFYNTLTNSCATNIADHLNALLPGIVPKDYRLLLPKESDALAHELGFIDNNIPLETLRSTYLANERIIQAATATDFSVAIRKIATTTDSDQ